MKARHWEVQLVHGVYSPSPLDLLIMMGLYGTKICGSNKFILINKIFSSCRRRITWQMPSFMRGSHSGHCASLELMAGQLVPARVSQFKSGRRRFHLIKKTPDPLAKSFAYSNSCSLSE